MTMIVSIMKMSLKNFMCHLSLNQQQTVASRNLYILLGIEELHMYRTSAAYLKPFTGI